jgi:photosystem II stability/assembly factor-like uncharacterized protein
MRVRARAAAGVAIVGLLAVLPLRGATLQAPQTAIDAALFRGMTWRSIGPFRGGRMTAIAGTPSRPNLFYAGAASGGLWQTTDAGQSWRAVFDSEPVGSIGAVAMAAANPDVVYVGTGEAPFQSDASIGNGLYRSDNGGRTWSHLGLAGSGHIPAIAVDPTNADRVFVAATGRSIGPSTERGIFRTTNAGRSFEQVLAVGETGALDVLLDPTDAAIVYAVLWQVQHRAAGTVTGPGTGLHKSVDGGSTWRRIGQGLPTFAADGLARLGIAVAPGHPRRLYVVAEARLRSGLYRSDDGGETWSLVNDSLATERAEPGSTSVTVDPRNPDTVYLTGWAVRRSIDGGRTFTTWRADPTGASYFRLWINPSSASHAVIAGARGTIVTVNGGESWSSTFNQPTGQFAHVATDHAFPYRVCGAERGRAPGCLPSRGESGQIAASDWHTVGRDTNAFVAPDPADADVVYGGAVARFDRRTTQTQDVRPPDLMEVAIRGDTPVMFSPADPRSLFLAVTRIWRTANGGQTWNAFSPELSRGRTVTGEGSVGVPPSEPRGLISALAPSAIDGRIVWAGTDDGLIHVTRDGGLTWSNVSPPALTPWTAVSGLEASHFDTSTAYAAIDTTLTDRRPELWRTRDGGATWVEITPGLLSEGVVYGVREDPYRRGLLFAGGDRSVAVSFDDGERWQSLRLNLPPTPVRDLVIKESSLVAATYGRGFWILDDISVLRQITADIARSDLYLFRPATAWRSSARVSALAALDEPGAPNPPDGVALSYFVGSANPGPIAIEIIETISGEVIRRFSTPASAAATEGPTPPVSLLRSTAGLHHVVWDLQFAPVDGRSVRVAPGTYQVRLTAASRVLRQAVIVRADPRTRATAADFAAQLKLSKAVHEKRREVAAARAQLRQAAASSVTPTAAAALNDAARALDLALDALQASDTRPTAAIEAAATAAIERATLILADGK